MYVYVCVCMSVGMYVSCKLNFIYTNSNSALAQWCCYVVPFLCYKTV